MQYVPHRFRPLMGIILFNDINIFTEIRSKQIYKFPSPNGDYFI